MTMMVTTVTGALRRPAPTTYAGFWSWITTVDHKRIAVLYGVSAFIFFLVAGLEALVMRVQLAAPDNSFVGPQVFNQMFTMHGTSMVFLVVMPFTAAFFNYMIPLMIGARDVAFPRLNALSYWVFLGGAIFLHIGFLTGEAPDAGWFGYANLTEKPFSPTHSVDYWALGIQILGVSSLIAALNFLVTIINMRAPGMTLLRMPVFVWMSLVTMILILLAFPVITVALIMLTFDRFFGTNFFNVAAGADLLLWQHFFWVFGHPEVYILVLPAMGIISEVLPTYARKPLFGYHFVVYSGIMIAFLSFGVWSHHMFQVGLPAVADAVFAVTTMLIAIPTGVKIFNWIGTLYGGSLVMKAALYNALGFVSMFIIGGLSGVMHSSAPTDLQQTDTYFIVAHFHYVLFGGSIFGLFAGAYHWWPKMTGRFLDEGLGKLQFWVMLIGFNLTFFPMHFIGLLGMPRRVWTYPAEMGVAVPNFIATIGAFVIGLALLIFLYNAFTSLRRGAVAGGDPWDGRTLEWSIPSPPPEYNFATIPVVHSREPHWDAKYPTLGHGGRAHALERPGPGHGNPGHDPGNGGSPGHGEAHGEIHIPWPSYFPVLAGIGLFLVFFGLIFGYFFSAIGILVLLVSIYGWVLEPVAG